MAEPAHPELFKEVRRTARVTYYAAKGHSVDVKHTEAFLDRLAELFGRTPDGWRLEYYRHDSPRILHADLGASAYGVTDLDRMRIDSVRDFHPHELVHAMAARFGRPPLVFAEGLAVALTSQGRWQGSDIDQTALQALAAGGNIERFLDRFTEQDPQSAYAVAGSLVGYLLERHGIDRFLEFLRGCSSDDRAFETPFRRAYGMSFARATIDWQQALRQGPHPAPEWYDAATWPRSLERERPTRPAAPQPARVAASGHEGAASPYEPRAAADVSRVLDSASHDEAAPATAGVGSE